MKIVPVAIVLAIGLFWVFLFVSGLYGIFLGFSAGILMGILVLLLPPAAVISGLIGIFMGVSLPQKAHDWLSEDSAPREEVRR